LYAQSLRLGLSLGESRALQVLTDITHGMVEGELLQNALEGRIDAREDQVLNVARRKTAELFSGCARLGGVAARLPVEQEEAFACYGLQLGLAFQLIDDVLDFQVAARQLGKQPMSDLAKGLVTLPLIYALECCTTEEVSQVRTVPAERGFSSVEPGQIRRLVRRRGGLTRALAQAARHAATAKSALDAFPPCPEVEILREIPRLVIERQR